MAGTSEKTSTMTEPRQCKKREVFGHAIGVLGHDSAYTLWYQWATPFMTDILAVPAAVLGVMLAVGRLFDAFTDISMGVIADRTRSKWGRFRPWLLWAGPFFCICMGLSFLKLPISNTALWVYAGVLYILTGSIFFTAVDIPFWSLPSAMTSNTVERGQIIGSTTTVSSAISAIIGIGAPVALSTLGEFKWTSYFIIAGSVAVFGIIMYLISFSLVKEHVQPDPAQQFSLKLGLQNIFQNKPLLMLTLTNFACKMGMILKGGFNYYYFTYNVGNLSLMGVASLISLFAQVLGSLLFTVISRWIGKKKCMFGLVLVLAASNIVLYMVGWNNLLVLFTCSGVSSLCLGAVFVCINAMLADTIEYGEWKTGQRNEGLINSTRCFVSKVTTAIAGIAVAAVLGLTGYVAGAEQSAAVLNSFHAMYTLFCGGVIVIAIVPLFFYDLTEARHAEIMEELAARKANKDKN